MLDKVKPILGFTLILIIWISIIILLITALHGFILLISPKVLNIGCGGMVLLLIGLNVFQKTWVEIRTNGHINVFRWLGLLFATLLFIGFYEFINGINTMQQIGCGFALFCIVLLVIFPFSPPSIIGDDEDDYHASR